MMKVRVGWSFSAVPLLAVLGCSDPVPLPAQANLSLSVRSPSTNVSGMGCPVTAMAYELGNPGAPTTSSAGQRIVDGQKGSTISCSVRGKGPFTFSAAFEGISSDFSKVTVSFVNGQIGADKTSGSATISVFTTQLSGNFASANGGCTLSVVNQQIKGGSIWTQFSCPGISQPPSSLCATDGVVIFENCDGV